MTLKNIFKIAEPDYKLSPYTGLDRNHWVDAAIYLLNGAFSHVSNIDDPLLFPLQKGKSYPHHLAQLPTVYLEGFCRTLFIASPLLREQPDLMINNISLSEYYFKQLVNILDENSETFIDSRKINQGPSQNLVEFGALSICLFIIPHILWDPLTEDQKNKLAALMLSYGDGPTIPSNWKFFNVFILSFFKSQNYSVNEVLLEDYLSKTLEHYVGDGWYNDNPAFDYYSFWSFQTYGILWSEFFGKKYYPKYVEQFIANFKDLIHFYPRMFSRSGEMIMWGRSISYRFAASSVFSLMGFLKSESTINWGWMRRIASGNLLQFLSNPKFLKSGVPTLGFYGEFEPAVQNYSCRASTYWCGKFFLGLLIPSNSPFWTESENNGEWEKQDTAQNLNIYSQKTGILVSNYSNIGASEIRSWCNIPLLPPNNPFRGFEGYYHLSYNSAFPWQLSGNAGEVAMNYIIKNKFDVWEPLHCYNFKGYNNGVYYREAKVETNPLIKFHLAEIPFSEGILRIDKIEYDDTNELLPFEIRLGHYALPKYKARVKKECIKMDNGQLYTIDNGEYTLGFISLHGFDKIETLKCINMNPVTKESYLINAVDLFDPNEYKKRYYFSFVIWKKTNSEWFLRDLDTFKVRIINDQAEVIFMDKTLIL